MAKYAEPLREVKVETRPSFETLLAEISSRFVHVPAFQLDREIDEALRLICGALDVDESTIFLREFENPDVFVLTYVLRDPSLPPPPRTRFTAAENFPWCNSKLIANEIICLPDIEDAPPEATVDKAMWRKYGIYSALVIPLSTGGQRPVGFWGIDSTSRKRDWPESLQKRLKIIADVFANALERVEYERELREREARLRLAANTTGAGFWTIDTETGVVWTTSKLKELFGLKPDQLITTGDFLEIVHREDREAVRQAIESIGRGHEATVEYRIVSADGSVHWVLSRGNRHEYFPGKPPLLMGITLDITERHMVEEALSTLGGRLLEAQEQERKRIARELHDGINQQVAMIAFGIQQLHLADDLPSAERHQKIDHLSKDTQKVAAEIQALSHEIHSYSLEYLGLVSAIVGFCDELRARHHVETRVTHSDVPKKLRPDLALAIFRITQEALHNALKHSGVDQFEVRLQGTQCHLELTIRDNGVGFNVNKATRGRGLGLISMRERVLALRGAISIDSQPGRGTEIHVRVPIDGTAPCPGETRRVSARSRSSDSTR